MRQNKDINYVNFSRSNKRDKKKIDSNEVETEKEKMENILVKITKGLSKVIGNPPKQSTRPKESFNIFSKDDIDTEELMVKIGSFLKKNGFKFRKDSGGGRGVYVYGKYKKGEWIVSIGTSETYKGRTLTYGQIAKV